MADLQNNIKKNKDNEKDKKEIHDNAAAGATAALPAKKVKSDILVSRFIDSRFFKALLFEDSKNLNVVKEEQRNLPLVVTSQSKSF